MNKWIWISLGLFLAALPFGSAVYLPTLNLLILFLVLYFQFRTTAYETFEKRSALVKHKILESTELRNKIQTEYDFFQKKMNSLSEELSTLKQASHQQIQDLKNQTQKKVDTLSLKLEKETAQICETIFKESKDQLFKVYVKDLLYQAQGQMKNDGEVKKRVDQIFIHEVNRASNHLV